MDIIESSKYMDGTDYQEIPPPMDWKTEYKPLAVIITVFLVFFYLPVGAGRFDKAVLDPCTWPNGMPRSMCFCVSFRRS